MKIELKEITIRELTEGYQDKDVFRAAMAYETAAGEWFTQVNNRPSI